MFGRDTASEIILSTLAKKWPLRAKEVYLHVNKVKGMTYQAVHKALEQLVEKKMLVKLSGKYAFDSTYIAKMRKNWESLDESYKTENYGKTLKLIVPEANYLFEPESVLVDSIPSVFISKSTFLEFIEKMPVEELDKLSRKVAFKDHELIAKKLNNPELLDKKGLEKIVFLKKLNELANTYYWGKVSYTINKNTVDVKITSHMFTTKKARYFYEKIYFYYMQLLGFKLQKKNDLLQTYTFEAI